MIFRMLAPVGLALALAAFPAAGIAQAQPEPATAGEAAVPFVADGEPGSFGHDFAVRLYGESLGAGGAFAEARLAAAPDDQTAQMALGMVAFAEAVQGLGRDLYRHGLQTPEDGILPFFRLPVERNPTPEPLDYQGARAILIRFAERLAVADAAFAGVDDPAVEIRLRPALIRFDSDGDGVLSEADRFGPVYGQYTLRRGDPQGRVDFDASDAPWFRGYCHLLSAIAEAWLAHDWHEGFEISFQALFPDAGLPNAALNDWPRKEMEQLAKQLGNAPSHLTERPLTYAFAADMVAFLHLIHWPVTEPERLGAARDHLKTMIAMSRESWRRIEAETDDGQEWVPGPHQSLAAGEGRPARVTEETVKGWLQFLDTFEALLDGRLLLPHWRLERGINLRRAIEAPRTFDLLLWIQGSAALPYVEDGPMAGKETWRTITRLMGGDFLTYFIWFN